MDERLRQLERRLSAGETDLNLASQYIARCRGAGREYVHPVINLDTTFEVGEYRFRVRYSGPRLVVEYLWIGALPHEPVTYFLQTLLETEDLHISNLSEEETATILARLREFAIFDRPGEVIETHGVNYGMDSDNLGEGGIR